MPPHVRRGGARGRSNTPRHAAQARASLSAGRSAPRTQGKFAAFDEFCKRLEQLQRLRHLTYEDFRKAYDTVPNSAGPSDLALPVQVAVGHVAIVEIEDGGPANIIEAV